MVQREYRPAGTFQLRYEDISQDGRALINSIPPALGAVWRALLADVPDANVLQKQGIMPILSRIKIDVTEHVVSPFRPYSVEGYGEQTSGIADDYTRVLFNVRARVSAKGGHAVFPGAPSEVDVVGTLFAEHVFTRPFAEKDKRRVAPADLRAAGLSVEGEQPFEPARSVITEPEGATAIDPAFVRGETPLALGLMHTDANQHVNSLVYPRLFEEAVLRRLAALGRPLVLRARSLEIGYRRPSFVGDVLRVDTRLYERPAHDGQPAQLHALGVFTEMNKEAESGRVFVRLVLAG